MPRPARITRDDVLRAALEIIDDHGLEALTMRRLGEALGVEAMSVYRHVPGKAALLDGVHEAVLATMRIPRKTGDWKKDVRALAHSLRRALRAHPRAIPLFAMRPAVTPGSLRHVERALAALQQGISDPRHRLFAYQAIVALCVGQCLAHFTTSDAEVDYGALSPVEFPLVSAVSEHIDSGLADEEFAFALDALVEGLALRA